MAKKEINGNELGNSLFSDRERMELWFAANWKKCVLVVVGLILLSGIAVTWYYVSEKKEADFVRRLNEAKSAKEIAEIIAERPDHDAVHAARLRMAQDLLAKGEVKAAKAEFEKLAAAAKAASALQESGKIGVANCLELLGEAESAMKSYQTIADDVANSLPTRAEAGFHAARLMLAAGNNADAKKMAERVAELGNDGARDIYVLFCGEMVKNFDNITVKKAPAQKAPAQKAPAKGKK